MRHLLHILFVSITVLFLSSCGTLGHIAFYNFESSKSAIENDLKSLINMDSLHVPPTQWNGYEKGQDSLYDIFIYYKEMPKEIYLVRFTNKENWESSKSSKLGLVGTFDGSTWHFEKDLNSEEVMRVMNRFESSILLKMKYKYIKE